MHQCEFFLLRYVPDLVKDEFVNIGVVLSATESGFSDMRFTTDWSRTLCLNPAADLEMLDAVHSEIRSLLHGGAASREQIVHRIQDSFSNTIQVSPPKASLAQSPQAEIEELSRLYLQTASREKAARLKSPREKILRRMQEEFTSVGVWQRLWREIPASKYADPGDPLTIDCGYKPNGILRMFHALPLKSDANAAKSLAFTYPRLAQGLLGKEQLKTELTAIVEPDLNRAAEPVKFAFDILERSSIRIAPVTAMPEIGERARQELGL